MASYYTVQSWWGSAPCLSKLGAGWSWSPLSPPPSATYVVPMRAWPLFDWIQYKWYYTDAHAYVGSGCMGLQGAEGTLSQPLRIDSWCQYRLSYTHYTCKRAGFIKKHIGEYWGGGMMPSAHITHMATVKLTAVGTRVDVIVQNQHSPQRQSLGLLSIHVRARAT